MNIGLLFRPPAQLEEKLCGLYEWFAQHLDDDPEARFLFFRLASDETGHVALIEYERRMVMQNPALFGEVQVDPEALRQSIQTVDRLRSAASPSLQEAVAVALELESSAAEYHYRTAIKQANPEVSRLLDSLGASDNQHAGALKAFAEKRGIVPGAGKPA